MLEAVRADLIVPLLGVDTCTRSCTIKVMTTNIKPVSVAAAAPTRT